MTEAEVLNIILRNDLYFYIKKAFYEVTGGEKFIDSWHLELMCDTLEQCRKGKIKRLIINVPPRSLKSIIATVGFSSWLLGHDPTEKVISVSYSSELSEKFARDTKLVMNSPWYQRAFHQTRISRDRHTAYDFTTTARGGRFSTSVEGTLTGRGGNFIIIDDPIKPTDIGSENTFSKVNNWYRNTLLSRLNNKETGCIILIMQRLHEDDLSGYLLEKESGWHHLKIPAIAEEDETWNLSGGSTISRSKGEVICPAQLSRQTLDEFKRSMGSIVFEGQYQQNPAPMEGAIMKTKWFKFYTQSELPNFEKIIMSWDTASKAKEANAYSACCIFGVTNTKQYYLLEVYRERLELPALFKKIKGFDQKYKQRYSTAVDLLIEDAASGIQIIQLLKEEGFYCTAIKPNGDKLSRFKGAAVIAERGDIFVPQTQQSWWAAFENELIRFPNSKYKDQADSFSQVFSPRQRWQGGAW